MNNRNNCRNGRNRRIMYVKTVAPPPVAGVMRIPDIAHTVTEYLNLADAFKHRKLLHIYCEIHKNDDEVLSFAGPFLAKVLIEHGCDPEKLTLNRMLHCWDNGRMSELRDIINNLPKEYIAKFIDIMIKMTDGKILIQLHKWRISVDAQKYALVLANLGDSLLCYVHFSNVNVGLFDDHTRNNFIETVLTIYSTDGIAEIEERLNYQFIDYVIASGPYGKHFKKYFKRVAERTSHFNVSDNMVRLCKVLFKEIDFADIKYYISVLKTRNDYKSVILTNVGRNVKLSLAEMIIIVDKYFGDNESIKYISMVRLMSGYLETVDRRVGHKINTEMRSLAPEIIIDALDTTNPIRRAPDAIDALKCFITCPKVNIALICKIGNKSSINRRITRACDAKIKGQVDPAEALEKIDAELYPKK